MDNLFVGTLEDYDSIKSDMDFYTVIAAKEPYHRLAVGYRGRSCGRDNPEYLFALRERCLICNLVDVDNPEWISPIIIERIFDSIKGELALGKKVLICCNKGRSRSATIGLMYLKQVGYFNEKTKFEEAEKLYREIYPEYDPADGIRIFAENICGMSSPHNVR